MIFKNYISIVLFVVSLPIWSQHTITIDASLNDSSKTIDIRQQVLFENTTGTPLDTLYFHDWANSFSTKKSPLGVRLEENYVGIFHFEKDKDRGSTNITNVSDQAGNPLVWTAVIRLIYYMLYYLNH